MKPYIKYKENVYEFSATFKLQKEYKQKLQELVLEDQKEILENVDKTLLGQFLKDREDINKLNDAEEQEKQALILIEKYPFVKKMVENSNKTDPKILDLNLSMCFKMLKDKYKMEESLFDEIIDSLCEEQGYSYVERLVSSICNTVFSQAVEEKPQMINFDWETRSQQN